MANHLARPVLMREEIQRIKDFGLGRGIDCTDEFPWINKKAVQVCLVEFETVIGTEEGGALDSFDHKVDGVEDWKPAKCSLPIAPIYLDLDVEYSRSSTQNRHTIGKRVATRTMSLIPPGTLVAGQNDDSIVEFFTKYNITHYVSEIQLGAEMYRTATESQYTSLVSGKGTFGVENSKPFSDLKSSKSWKKTENLSSLKQIGNISTEGRVERGSYDEAVIKVRFESITSLMKDATTKGRLQRLIKSYTKSRQGQFRITCNEGKLFLSVGDDGKVRGTPRKRESTYFHLVSVDGGKDSDEFVLGYYIKGSENSEEEDSGGEDCSGEDGDKGHGATNGDLRTKHTTEHQNDTPSLDQDSSVQPKKHNHQGLAEEGMAQVPISGSINSIDKDMFVQSTERKLAHYLHVTRSCCRSEPLQMVDRTDEDSSRLTAFSRLFNRDRRVSPSEWIRGEDMFYICTRAGYLRKRGYLCVKAERPYNTACTTYYNNITLYTLFQAVPRKVKFPPNTI